MTGFNRVVLIGNLTREPELRQLPSGDSVSDLGLAVNERFRDKQGEIREKTCFVDVVVWGRQADSCCKYLSKGAPLLVEGRLQFDRWETADGEKRSKLRVRADKTRFMGGRNNGATNGNGTQVTSHAVETEEDDNMPF